MSSARSSVHEGVTCNACKRADFRGKRYKCLVCYDYDLCETCYEEGVTESAHNGEHAVQCILTPADFELYYAGEPADQPQSFTCPVCAEMGFTLDGLRDHVSGEHMESTTRVVCPVCAATPGGDQNHVTEDLAGHLITRHARTLDDLDDEPASRRPQVISTCRFGAIGGPVPGRQPQIQRPPNDTLPPLSPPESVAGISVMRSRVSTVARPPSVQRRSGATAIEIQQEIRTRIEAARQQFQALEQQQSLARFLDTFPPLSSASSLPRSRFSEPVDEVPKPTLVEPPAADDPRFLLNRLVETGPSNSRQQAREVELANRSLFVQELLLSALSQRDPVGSGDPGNESKSSGVTENGAPVQGVTTRPDPTAPVDPEPNEIPQNTSNDGAEPTATTSLEPVHVTTPEPAVANCLEPNVTTNPQSVVVASQGNQTTTAEPGAGDPGTSMTASAAPTNESQEPNPPTSSGNTVLNPDVDCGQLPSSK